MNLKEKLEFRKRCKEEHLCYMCGQPLFPEEKKYCPKCMKIKNDNTVLILGAIAGACTLAVGVLDILTKSKETYCSDGYDSFESLSNEPIGQEIEPQEINRTLYTTNEWHGYGKQNYYHNEYRLENDEVVQYKAHRQKVFDGEESIWQKDMEKVQSWKTDDPTMPEWLHEHLN
jgi:hypothetical protein